MNLNFSIITRRRFRILILLFLLLWTGLILGAWLFQPFHGLRGSYFNNLSWEGPPQFTRVDPKIFFSDLQFRERFFKEETFSVAWAGFLYAPRNGTYSFSLTSDDGSFLYVDGALLIDNGGRHSLHKKGGEILLNQGLHPLRVLFFDAGGESGMYLSWQPPGGRPEIIPPHELYPFRPTPVGLWWDRVAQGLKSTAPGVLFVILLSFGFGFLNRRWGKLAEIRANIHRGPVFFYLGLLVLYASFSLLFTHFHFSLNRIYGGADLPSLMRGTAEKPYQYRFLIPYLVNLIYENVPLLHFREAPEILFKAVEVVCLISLLLTFRYLLIFFFENRKTASVLALSLFYALPFNFIFPRYAPFWYPWDIPSILFFTLGWVALYRKQWLLFYPVFILGTLNRETTCFLGVIYLVTAFGREKPGKIVLHVLVMAAIWLTIKGCLSRTFAQNPGSLFLFVLVDNYHYLSRPGNVLSVLSSFGFLWILVLLCFRRISDRFIRRSQVVALPFFVGMLLVGAIVEIRVFGELIPLVLAAVLLILKGFSKAASNQETRRITGPSSQKALG